MSTPKREITKTQAKEAESALISTVWQPGQSGNPTGRPKEPDDLLELLRVLVGKNNAKLIFKNLIFLAAPPEDSKVPYHVQLGAISEILDRLVGKPRQADREEGGVPYLVQLVQQFHESNQIEPEARSLRINGHTIDAPSIREDVSESSWSELP